MKRPPLVFAFFATVIMVIVMRVQGAALITPFSKRGIIDLEFAWDNERLRLLKLFWSDRTLYLNILLDFLFIASYTWFFISACRYFRKHNIWPSMALNFETAAIAAAIFDVLENFLMFLVWNGTFTTKLLPVVYLCALVKFILAAVLLLFIIAGFIRSVLKRND